MISLGGRENAGAWRPSTVAFLSARKDRSPGDFLDGDGRRGAGSSSSTLPGEQRKTRSPQGSLDYIAPRQDRMIVRKAAHRECSRTGFCIAEPSLRAPLLRLNDHPQIIQVSLPDYRVFVKTGVVCPDGVSPIPKTLPPNRPRSGSSGEPENLHRCSPR